MAIASDNVVKDAIPNGLFDQMYRLRAFVSVPEFGGWTPDDRIQILGFDTSGDKVETSTQPFSEMVGVYLKANKLYGTHVLREGMTISRSTRYCVEVGVAIHGDTGAIDQLILVDGVEVASIIGADPDWWIAPFDREPPSGALA